MDLIDGLPTSQGKSTIYTIVDRLSKYAHFIPISHPFTAVTVSQIFLIKFSGYMECPFPLCVDPTFTNAFWKEIFRLNGASFNFSSSITPKLMVKLW